MKHYGIIHWVDFARGVISGGEEACMREHLAAGCMECRQLAAFCTRVSETAQNLVQAPAEAVRTARAIFPVRAIKRPKRSFLLPVELIYDSLLAPAPAGLRSSWQVGWQGLYRAGNCSLDLRIEPELKSSRAAVIGQITNHVEPRQDMANMPVCLKAGRVVVAETVSNRFGEFQMEYEQQERLQLCVYLEGGAQCIRVALKRRAADGPSGGGRLRVGVRRGKAPGSK